LICLSHIYFFFQAEDGIRDRNVTGVQTCALPIYNTTNFKAPDASLQSQSLTHNTSAGKWTNFTYDLNYQGHFDSAGKELSIDMEIGRASCRERVWSSVVGVVL